MIRAIDHLVIACHDPHAAADELAARLGLEATGGGRHERFGTRNRIAWLADGSYIELIGVEDQALAGASPVGTAAASLLDRGDAGLATYALVADDLEATVSTLRAAGSTLGDATYGSRKRDDGELVEWWTSFPSGDLRPDGPPFVIQHAMTGAEWGAEAMQERATFEHPIGSPVRLIGLDVATSEPLAAAAAMHAELGVDMRAVADLAVADLGPHVLRYVPQREMPVPAVVRLGATVDAPTTVELLGLRFDVARVEAPVTTI